MMVPMGQQTLETQPGTGRPTHVQETTTGYRQNGLALSPGAVTGRADGAHLHDVGYEPGDRRHELAHRRQELGGFLRSRRERILPEQVGLPPASRRRTP